MLSYFHRRQGACALAGEGAGHLPATSPPDPAHLRPNLTALVITPGTADAKPLACWKNEERGLVVEDARWAVSIVVWRQVLLDSSKRFQCKSLQCASLPCVLLPPPL